MTDSDLRMNQCDSGLKGSFEGNSLLRNGQWSLHDEHDNLVQKHQSSKNQQLQGQSLMIYISFCLVRVVNEAVNEGR